MDERSPPAKVGSSAGLGASSESAPYQEWLSANGELTRLGVASFGWLAWSAAVEAERERCARIAEVGANGTSAAYRDACRNAAALIRGQPCGHFWNVTQEGMTYHDLRCDLCGETKRETWD